MKKVAEDLCRYASDALVPRVLAPEFAEYGQMPDVHTLAFSDTIAVTATLPRVDLGGDERRHVNALLIDFVSQSAAYVMRKAPQASPPLVYRGVVTWGDLLVEHPFFLGPAIDEAAELHEKADGAFVWLASSAEEQTRHRRPYLPHVWESMAVRYTVPLKSGVVETIALSPYVDLGASAAERAAIREGMLRAMDKPNPAVVRKRDNTVRLIDHITAAAPPTPPP